MKKILSMLIAVCIVVSLCPIMTVSASDDILVLFDSELQTTNSYLRFDKATEKYAYGKTHSYKLSTAKYTTGYINMDAVCSNWSDYNYLKLTLASKYDYSDEMAITVTDTNDKTSYVSSVISGSEFNDYVFDVSEFKNTDISSVKNIALNFKGYGIESTDSAGVYYIDSIELLKSKPADKYDISGVDELVINNFGQANFSSVTLDSSVKLFEKPTALWNTTVQNNEIKTDGQFDVSNYGYFNIAIFNPTNITDKQIELYLGRDETVDMGSWKANYCNLSHLNITKTGWNVIQIPMTNLRVGYGSEDVLNEHKYTKIRLYNNSYVESGKGFNTDNNSLCEKLYIGKVWFGNNSVSSDASKSKTTIDYGKGKQTPVDQYSSIADVYKISFDYKTDKTVEAGKKVYAALEIDSSVSGTAKTEKPIWIGDSFDWNTYTLNLDTKFDIKRIGIKTDYTINSLTDAIKASDEDITLTVKNLVVYTSAYNNAINCLARTESISSDDNVIIAADKLLSAGKDSEVCVYDENGIVNSAYALADNKIAVFFDKTESKDYRITYSGFYDAESVNEFSGDFSVYLKDSEVLTNSFDVQVGSYSVDGNAISVEYNYSNGTDNDKKATLIVAIYDDKTLEKIITKDYTCLKSGRKGELSIAVTSSEAGDTTGKKIKSFAVDNLDTIHPLCISVNIQ